MNKQKWVFTGVLANLVLTLGLLALFGYQTVRALSVNAQTAPGVISYQGVLSSSGGTPVNGNRDVGFAIYATESGGAPLWQEAHSATLVRSGAFAVLLGQNTSFPDDLFSQPDRWLEISVDNEVLTPRQKFSSVPYAINADRLDGFDVSELTGSGVPSGGVVYFPLDSDPAGFTPIAGALAMDLGTWEPIAPSPILPGQYYCSLWTGSKVYCLPDQAGFEGASFDVTTNTWQVISGQGAPAYNQFGTVWTGSQIIVWKGGTDNPGTRYDPATDTWTPISTSGAPLSLTSAAVWAGEKMFIWGESAGLYDPVNDTWSPVSTVGAPSPGYFYSFCSLWTGSKVIVYGGEATTSALYDPEANT